MRSTKPLPFGFNPKVEHRNSRLRKMLRAGKLKRLTKAQARILTASAAIAAGYCIHGPANQGLCEQCQAERAQNNSSWPHAT